MEPTQGSPRVSCPDFTARRAVAQDNRNNVGPGPEEPRAHSGQAVALPSTTVDPLLCPRLPPRGSISSLGAHSCPPGSLTLVLQPRGDPGLGGLTLLQIWELRQGSWATPGFSDLLGGLVEFGTDC